MKNLVLNRIFFCILFYSVSTSSEVVSLSLLSCILPFLFTVQRTQHKHPCPGWNFFFFCFLFVLHPYFCVLTVQHTQHKHPFPRRSSNPRNPRMPAVANPRLRPLGHWDRRDSNPGPSSPYRVAKPTALYRPISRLVILETGQAI